MIKNIYYRLMAKPHRKQALEQLQALEQKLISERTRFAVPFAYRGKGFFKTIQPRQNPWEIEELYKIILELAPRRVLEVGTARGGTLYLWTQAAAPDATIVSVDLPEGEFGGAYPACRIPFYGTFARFEQKLHLLRDDSHKVQTIKKVIEIFDNNPIDFVFIDGDHTFEGVKTDFLNYGPMVRPGGIVALHDILPRYDLSEIQVDRFWQRLKKKYRVKELIGMQGSGRKIGIGLVYVEGQGICNNNFESENG
ncbi:MAG: class I SAM-dependent methyltransferase [Deltaproteobacteria bacterium]|nr:MAG: class I SAM-dependent methyltransferase [Deltaproteobacteria bacterium]